jgi:RNA polymerase sigma factor (sigma-70 family)
VSWPDPTRARQPRSGGFAAGRPRRSARAGDPHHRIGSCCLIRTSPAIPDIPDQIFLGADPSPALALGSTRRGAPLRHQDFERLYAAHASQLLAFLVYRTGDRALAEDLLADTFERVLRGRGRFDPRRGGEKTWLYAIALNCLRDHARRRSAEQRALEGSAPGADETVATDAVLERDVVHRSLGALSADERLAVALRFGADLTMPEIAKLTGEPLTTVEGRIYRALGKLRAELGPP